MSRSASAAPPLIALFPLLARRHQVPVHSKFHRRHPSSLVRATIAPAVSCVSRTTCSTPCRSDCQFSPGTIRFVGLAALGHIHPRFRTFAFVFLYLRLVALSLAFLLIVLAIRLRPSPLLSTLAPAVAPQHSIHSLLSL